MKYTVLFYNVRILLYVQQLLFPVGILSLTLVIFLSTSCSVHGTSKLPTDTQSVISTTVRSTETIEFGGISTPIPTIEEIQLVVTPTTTPTPPIISILSTGQYLLFSANDGLDNDGYGVYSIFVASIEGDILGRVIEGYQNGVISPESEILLVKENQSIDMINLLTGEVSSIPDMEDCAPFSWSPDEDSILLACRNDDYISNVYLYSFDDISKIRLSNCTGSPSYCSYPSWSPDGKWISFVQGEGRSGVAPPTDGIYVVDTECLLDPPTCPPKAFQVTRNRYEEYSWAPDGSSIALSYSGGQIGILEIPSGNLKIIRMENDLSRNISKFSWSPDGNWLAFEYVHGIVLLSTIDDEIIKIHEGGGGKKIIGWISVGDV